MAKLAINQILDTSISSYNWPLDIFETIYDWLQNDLREIETDGKVKLDSGENIDTKSIDCDFLLVDNYVEQEAKTLADSLELGCLEKYGIKIKGFEIWKPKYYNFEDDELLMDFETEGGDWKEKYPELIPFVKDYIENVRQKSRDGYISFEPDKVEDVKMDDFAYIRAILKKEDMLENNKFWIDLYGIQNIWENTREYLDSSRYEYNGAKYRLDYDNKMLVKLD